MGLSGRNYWMMLRRIGPRYARDTFTQVHWFDLRHGVETATMVSNDAYAPHLANIEHGIQYQPSWTRTTRIVFQQVAALLGDRFSYYTFVDVGCGKGKVLLCWMLEARKFRLPQSFIGVEYEPSLAQTATRNVQKMFPRSEARILTADVLDVPLVEIGRPLLLFLQNPFDELIMGALIDRVADVDHLILLANPTLSSYIESRGYSVVQRNDGYHQLDRSVILKPCFTMGNPISSPL